jgi:hypothetical protein
MRGTTPTGPRSVKFRLRCPVPHSHQVIRYARQQLGTVASARNWHGQSMTSPPVGIPHRRESNPALVPARQYSPLQLRACTLAEIGKHFGRKLLSDVACVAKPENILGWYRRLIARKFDGSKHRSYPGRPRGSPEGEALIVCMAKENGSWGYDRIAGALANIGHYISDQTVGNVLKRHGIPNAASPPPGRISSRRTWLLLREPTSSPRRS